MSRFLFVSTLLLNQFFLIIIIINSSKAFRTPESTYQSRNIDQQNAHQIQSQQSLSSKPVYDTLVSIDERLRLLEAYENTYKLTRLDFTLEQLSQRMVSIESKLSRLENAFDSKLSKVEELVLGKELKEELRSESITRKMEDFNDKVNNKGAQIETKFDIRIDKMMTKLDSMERTINSEEVLERLIKSDERDLVFESHVKSHIINIENLVKHSLDASTNIKEMVNHNIGTVDNFINTVKDCKHQQQLVISQLTAIVAQIQNSTLISHITDKHNRCQHQRQEKVENMRRNNETEQQINYENNTNTNSRNIDEPKEIMSITNKMYNNITSSLAQLQQLGVDEKLTQLDIHVDYYSRKIINTIQEIWRSSQTSESYLRDALDMANKTRSFIRQEFQRLQEQIAPFNEAPNLSQITEPLEQKLHHLSTTVDDSFNTVMISQNSFINSCHRVQQEEEQLYDILDDMLLEIRNKSTFDVSFITDTINKQILLFNTSFNHLFNKIQLIDHKVDNFSSSSPSKSSDISECFLTRNQLISVCNKNDPKIHSNTNGNNEQTVEEKSDQKIEANYDDLTHTED